MTRYTAALAALIDPTPEPLDRDLAATRARLAELLDEHHRHTAYLRRRLTLAADDDVAAERAVCAMQEAARRFRARRAALRVDHPDPPSLLEQLLDAVHGTGGAYSGASNGVHRSPATLAAVDLVATIRRHLGDRDGDLDTTLRHWQPADELEAAAHLDTWAAAIRALLDPPRSLEGVAPCPACGNRWVRVRDGDEWHRRAAIRIAIHPSGSPNEDYAECLHPACDGYWPRTRWNLLAAAMTTADKAG